MIQLHTQYIYIYIYVLCIVCYIVHVCHNKSRRDVSSSRNQDAIKFLINTVGSHPIAGSAPRVVCQAEPVPHPYHNNAAWWSQV